MKEKVVIITGASSGIGKALAWKYASEGFKVVIAARRKEQLQELARELESEGAEVLAVSADVSKEDDCRHLIDQTVENYGRIDILINNAGVSMRAVFEDLELDVLHKVMDINFWGTVQCTHAAFPYLLKSKGSVVGVSSVAGFQGLPGRTGYSASKAAINNFLDVIRQETQKKGLHVLLACPGFTSSDIRKTALLKDGAQQGETPRNESKMMSAEEVAEHIYRAVVRRKRTLILTRVGKMTVMLKKCCPRLLDKIVYKTMAREPNSPF
ncbi:MAG: SDR family oxidoreductase [Bacteroidales bacterium]|nr:SDR family oxidoreductase [Bacteroidales bacterium]